MNSWRVAAVGCGLSVLLVGGCADRPDVRIDHRVTTDRAAPLSDAGPPPGRYDLAWRTRLTTDVGAPSMQVVDGRLLVVSQEAIDVYDARTGEPAWHYREPGRELDGYATTDGVVVAAFESAGEAVEEQHAVGLDVATGELLWENTEEWRLTLEGYAGTNTTARSADAVDGVVPFADNYDDVRIGVDARTGDELWELSAVDEAGGDCADRPRHEGRISPDTNVLPVQLLCEVQDYDRGVLGQLLLTVEPDSGEVLWSRRLDSGDSAHADVQVRGGITMIEPGDVRGRPTLYGPDGRAVFDSYTARCSVQCGLDVGHGKAVLQYVEATGRTEHGSEATAYRIASIDLRSGKAVSTGYPGTSIPFAEAGGKVYGLSLAYGEITADGRQPNQLLPAGVLVIDPETRRQDEFPMPYASEQMLTGAMTKSLPEIAVAGGRMFTLQGSSASTDPKSAYRGVLSAYRSTPTSGPVELAGVSPDDWPDPCALLANSHPDQGYADQPRPGPVMKVGDDTVRTSCGQYTSTVRIGWVTRTEEEARRMFYGGQPSDIGADEERRFDDASGIFRVGRVILYIDAYESYDRTARAVLANLRSDG